MLDFLKQCGPFAPSLLYLWVGLAWIFAFSTSHPKIFKKGFYFLPFALLIFFLGFITIPNSINLSLNSAQFSTSLWLYYVVYLLTPFSSIALVLTTRDGQLNYNNPGDILFFRKPAAQSNSVRAFEFVRPKFIYLLAVIISFSVISLVSVVSLSLQTCWWLDSALSNSGCLRQFSNNTNTVYSVGFSSNGQQIALGGTDATLKLLDEKTGNLIKDLKGHHDYVMSVAFSPDDKFLASGALRGEIFLWKLDDGSIQRKLSVPLNESSWGTLKVIFSPDGTKLAVGGYKIGVRIFNLVDGSLLRDIPTPDSYYDVAFSPDGAKLATASKGSISIWNVQDGSPLKTINSSNTEKLAFSPDGSQIASAEKFIEIWNVSDGTLVQKLDGYAGRITSIAFSPDGKLLASSGTDDMYGLDSSSIRIWSLTEKHQVSNWKYPKTVVQGIAFSPDGSTLAAGSYGLVRLWRVST